MYKLYYMPNACSLATQVVFYELKQTVDIINKEQVSNFNNINPIGAVPVLNDEDKTLTEGAAILLYLLNKHENTMLPSAGVQREQAIQNIMFANATMHPAYNRLFFIAQNINDAISKQSAFDSAAQAINSLWQVVEQKLIQQRFLGGDQPSAADIMLTVYYRWGSSFPVNITLANNTSNMVNAVLAMPSFQRALDAEHKQSAV